MAKKKTADENLINDTQSSNITKQETTKTPTKGKKTKKDSSKSASTPSEPQTSALEEDTQEELLAEDSYTGAVDDFNEDFLEDFPEGELVEEDFAPEIENFDAEDFVLDESAESAFPEEPLTADLDTVLDGDKIKEHPSPENKAIIDALMEKGKVKGVITIDEINEALDDSDVEPDIVDKIYETAEHLGINIIGGGGFGSQSDGRNRIGRPCPYVSERNRKGSAADGGGGSSAGNPD